MDKIIGFLGPKGSFSQIAAQMIVSCQAKDYSLAPYSDLVGILEQVEQGALALGIVPVENSLEGSVAVVWDTLALGVGLSIVAEITLPIKHHLLAAEQTPLAGIKQVLSHPQALAQCRNFLRSNLPHATLVAVSSTSEAARLVAEKGQGYAAIGNTLAAEIYELKTLVSGIEDNSFNTTRFVLVSRSSKAPFLCHSQRMKTSLVFTTMTERAGILYDTLWEFASRKVNLTRIESRPAKRSLGEYLFYVDIEGSLAVSHVAEACSAVEQKAKFFKMLGSYPVLETPV